jgi:hypothetical protein
VLPFVNKTLDFLVFSNDSPTALSMARLANASAAAAAACTVYKKKNRKKEEATQS